MAFTLGINSKGLFGKVKNIQFKKASFYCTEEKRNYTMDELENK